MGIKKYFKLPKRQSELQCSFIDKSFMFDVKDATFPLRILPSGLEQFDFDRRTEEWGLQACHRRPRLQRMQPGYNLFKPNRNKKLNFIFTSNSVYSNKKLKTLNTLV